MLNEIMDVKIYHWPEVSTEFIRGWFHFYYPMIIIIESISFILLDEKIEVQKGKMTRPWYFSIFSPFLC